MDGTTDQREYDFDIDVMAPDAAIDIPDTETYPDVFNLAELRREVPVKMVKLEAHHELVLMGIIEDEEFFNAALGDGDDDALDDTRLKPLDVYEVLLLGNLYKITRICPSSGLTSNGARELQEMSKELVRMGIIPAMQFMVLRAATDQGHPAVYALAGFLADYIEKNVTLDGKVFEKLVARLCRVDIGDFFSRFEILYDTVKNHHESIGDADEKLAAEVEGVMRGTRADLGESWEGYLRNRPW